MCDGKLQQVKIAEEDARSSKDLLDQRTRYLQGTPAEDESNPKLERLEIENEELREKVGLLQSCLLAK